MERIEITARMDELLGDGAALLLPAATSAAPRLSLSSEETDPIWKSLAKLTAAAGLARLPQARAAFALLFRPFAGLISMMQPHDMRQPFSMQLLYHASMLGVCYFGACVS